MNTTDSLNFPPIDPKNTVRGWDFTKEDICIAKGEKNPPMLNVSLYLGKKCNVGCIGCFTNAGERRPCWKCDTLLNVPWGKPLSLDFKIAKSHLTNNIPWEKPLSLEEYYKIIDDCKQLGTKTIDFVGEGEPLLDPRIKEIVSYIHQQGMTPVIATNGLKLAQQPELVDFLYENNATVIIKINSFDKKFQDAYVQVPGYAEKRNQALSLLMEKGFNKSTPTRLMVNTLAINNVEDILDIYRRCRENNIIPQLGEYITTGLTQGGVLQNTNPIEKNTGLTLEEKTKYLKRLEPLTHEQKVELERKAREIDKNFWIERPTKETRAYYCGMVCTHVFGVLIDNEGNVRPCVWNEKILGNIRKDVLGDLRNTLTMKEIRRKADGGCSDKEYFTVPQSL